MPLVSEAPLLLIDAGVQTSGVLLLGAWLWRVVQKPPDATDSQLNLNSATPSRATMFDAAMALLVYFMSISALLLAFRAAGISSSNDAAPDAPARQWVDILSKVIACGFMLSFYVVGAAKGITARRALQLSGVAAATALIAFPICFVQLYGAKTLWRWFAPDAIQPIHPVLEAMRQQQLGFGAIALLAFAAVFMAPLSEELFFRGVLLDGLRAQLKRPWTAILISSVAFASIHGQPQDQFPLATLGAMLAYLRLRTGSLTACVLAHALFNARTMIYAILNTDLATNDW